MFDSSSPESSGKLAGSKSSTTLSPSFGECNEDLIGEDKSLFSLFTLSLLFPWLLSGLEKKTSVMKYV